MERKRTRHKGPTVDWKNKEKIISKKTYIYLTDDGALENSNHEVKPYKKEDLQQCCIFDPAFTVDSSSSETGESSSNEWVNCEDDINVVNEEKPQPAGMSVLKNRNLISSSYEETYENEISLSPQPSNPKPADENEESKEHKKESIITYDPDDLQTTKPVLQSEDHKRNVSNPCLNKVQVYTNRIEPYYDEKLLTGNPQTLLSKISKLYMGGYSEFNSLTGYVSESESSACSEDSTKRAIKSILKRGGKNQSAENAKKKVRFNLNLRSVGEVNSETSKLLIDKNVKESDKKIENEPKTNIKSTTESNFHDKRSKDDSKEEIVVSDLEIYRKQCHCQNDFTNKECFPNSKHDDKTIRTLIANTQECESISYDSLDVEQLLQKTHRFQKASSEFLKKKTIKNENVLQINRDREKADKPSINESISFTSTGVQSDQLENDLENIMCSKYRNPSKPRVAECLSESDLKSTELKNILTESQPLKITEDEYSLFIKDLVSGSGDKLAKFLISLSSEISSKSGEEKIANALMTVGIVREESHRVLDTVQRHTLNDNVKLKETKVDSKNRQKGIKSTKKINKNGLNIKISECKKKNERNLFINNRRSMSEINMRQLKAKEPYYNSYTEKMFHSSRLDQLFIKKTKDDCIWHNLSPKNPNTNSEVMGRLCEIMAELKQNVDKICRKESTIRIENAQIWLKENKKDEKKMSSDRLRKVSEKTKETYSQTIGTIDDVNDHIQRQSLGNTEILIVSNSKNEEINIKVNDKSTEKMFTASSEQNKTIDQLNEIEERKRFFEENRDVPFNIVFNEKTHLPTLKKGKYEFEIFEKIEGQVIHNRNLKNFMKKLTDNINSIKLNGLHCYDKPRNVEQRSSCSSSRNHKHAKPATNLITTFLNRLLKLRVKTPVKNSNRQVVSSKHWAGTERVSFIKSYLPDSGKEKNINPIKDEHTGSNDIGSFQVEHIASCIGCDREHMSMFDDDLWPDVIKTRYPNGMIHFGPLTLMPEPTYGSYESQCLKLKKCSPSKSTGRSQYIYNKHMKHMVKASMSSAQDRQPEAELSLEEFSETEREFYHQWSEIGKV